MSTHWIDMTTCCAWGDTRIAVACSGILDFRFGVPLICRNLSSFTPNSRLIIHWVPYNWNYRCKSKKDCPVLPAGVKFDPTDQELIEQLKAKVSATTRDFSLSSICSYQPSTASTTYATPKLRNFQVRHRSAVYLHKHIPLFIDLFFFLDADLVK